MKRFEWTRLDEAGRTAALARPESRADPVLTEAVAAIVAEVRVGGEAGLRSTAQRIDGSEPQFVPTSPLAAQARQRLDASKLSAVELAAANIRAFHDATLPQDVAVETAPGLTVRKIWRPIDRVGLYIPGGKTPLFSTLLMLAIPARAAGVREMVVVTPPMPGGGLDPVIALAADLCKIEAIWTVGGAQAIAALAFGAGAIPNVDKICGPGNAWVAEAKRQVAAMPGGPAIDMPAGPSELMVIAGKRASARRVAADLLSQAEHDPAAQVILVTDSRSKADEIAAEVEQQVEKLPRAEIARASLQSARVILASDLAEAIDIANLYAPEHLSLAVEDAEPLIARVRNAGAVFAGYHAAETFGDYLAGSSHVLPTDGAARAWGGVSTYTFLKAMTVQTVTADAARQMAAPAALLARMEGLEAHARAADARLEPAA